MKASVRDSMQNSRQASNALMVKITSRSACEMPMKFSKTTLLACYKRLEKWVILLCGSPRYTVSSKNGKILMFDTEQNKVLWLVGADLAGAPSHDCDRFPSFFSRLFPS